VLVTPLEMMMVLVTPVGRGFGAMHHTFIKRQPKNLPLPSITD
jgi:hypothetical protein